MQFCSSVVKRYGLYQFSHYPLQNIRSNRHPSRLDQTLCQIITHKTGNWTNKSKPSSLSFSPVFIFILLASSCLPFFPFFLLSMVCSHWNDMLKQQLGLYTDVTLHSPGRPTA